jgi:hypothetical protein
MPEFKSLKELLDWIEQSKVIGYLTYRTATVLDLFEGGAWDELSRLHAAHPRRLTDLRRGLALKAHRSAPDNYETYLLQGQLPNELLAIQVADCIVKAGSTIHLGRA